jgi:hypothetical protein
MANQQIQKGKNKKDQIKQYIEPQSPPDSPTDQSPVIPVPKSGSTTVVKLFSLSEADTDLIRDKCRNNKTTIAAAVIVGALLAVRVVFGPRAQRKQKKMPNHQAWVVTSSTRHLLPNSKLLEGSDKQTDPALMEFGGYGGSISHERFKFKETSDIWERCRAVKKHLSGAFLPSMRRMKLMNYIFRKPKIWKKLQSKVNVEDLTRTYSVEVANLGAWDSVYAPMNEAPEGLATADWFAGTLNNSFVGCRALFTVALISINNVMSFSVAYDSGTITEAEGDKFVKALEHTMVQLKNSTNNKYLVKNLENDLKF